MTDLRRSRFIDRVRSALSELAGPTFVPERRRLARAGVALGSGRAAARGSWLLLSDGRPALQIARRPR